MSWGHANMSLEPVTMSWGLIFKSRKTFSMYLETITPSRENSTIFKQTPPNYRHMWLPSWKIAAIYLFFRYCELHMSKKCINRRYIVLVNEFQIIILLPARTYATCASSRLQARTDWRTTSEENTNLLGSAATSAERCTHGGPV
jgi:hypothetical protein